MNKKVKLMKFLAVLITAIQAAMALYWLYGLYVIIAGVAGFAPFGHGALSNFLEDHYLLADFEIFGSLVIPAVSFMILQNIKMISKDMADGLKFTTDHVKKVKLTAWLFITKGILRGLEYSVLNGFEVINLLGIFEYGAVIGLIILALVPIFRHGVEMQIDSDMTV